MDARLVTGSYLLSTTTKLLNKYKEIDV